MEPDALFLITREAQWLALNIVHGYMQPYNSKVLPEMFQMKIAYIVRLRSRGYNVCLHWLVCKQ